MHRTPSHRSVRASLALGLAAVLAASLAPPTKAYADAANADSVYLIGEFVDPVCIFQHGMQGTLQKQCALVRGRVDQGMYFLDIRKRKLYSIIGQTHWEDPRQGFLDALGDTFAVAGKTWKYGGSSALAITGAWPYRSQPEPRYAAWPPHLEWSVLVGCGLLAAFYALALTWLGRRLGIAPPIERWRIACFASSLVVVLVALNGPVHDLSDLYLFSAHMVQHLLLAQLFAPLFVLGVPPWVWSWLLSPRPLGSAFRFLASVPFGFILYSVVFSLFHAPPFYGLMMRNHDIHIVMHLVLMATAVLMWWPVVGEAVVRNPLSPPAKMLYLFLLGTPMMAVAAIITFAAQPIYSWYALAPRFMGMAAVEDQRLGGLIMWVPGGLFYWVVMSVVFFRWSARESRAEVEDPILTGAAQT